MKSFCAYDAPSPEAIQRTARRNNLPIDRITQVRVLDPCSTGKIESLPDANDPNIVHVPGEVTYIASNGDRLPTVLVNQ